MIYEKYNSSYEKDVLELLNICFKGKSIISTSFRWKHFDQFFNNKGIAMVAIDEGNLCAFVCFTPVSVIRGSKKYNYYSCAVQATHPGYRRRGIVSELTRLIEREIGTGINYFGFSNEEGVKIDIHSKTINYTIIGQMKVGYLFSYPYFTKFDIKPVLSPKQISPMFDYFYFWKNKAYLNWRYLINPKNKYLYFDILDSGRIVGRLITKKHLFKYEILDICVMDINNYKNCIKAFAHYSFKKAIPICTITFLPNTFWNKIFPSFSIKKNIEMFFTVKSTDQQMLNIEKWVIQGGDIQ